VAWPPEVAKLPLDWLKPLGFSPFGRDRAIAADRLFHQLPVFATEQQQSKNETQVCDFTFCTF
jgi:hypothetical protein